MKALSSLFSSQSWHYSFGFHANLDFCFWVLERDGLRVPPFDRHPDGDGALRAAGLNAPSWWAWLERAIAAREERREFLKAIARHQAPPKRQYELETAALWNGAPGVGRRLMLLAEEFDEVSNERAAVKLELVSNHARSDTQLWKDLAPYRRTLPPVQIAAVGYPGPLQAPVPPATILLAVGNWHPTPFALAAAILEGMQALARSSQLPPV
jgi:hypothetical protein